MPGKCFLGMLSCPVTMKNVTKTNGGVLFNNSYRDLSIVQVIIMSFKFAERQNIAVKELGQTVTGRFDSSTSFNSFFPNVCFWSLWKYQKRTLERKVLKRLNRRKKLKLLSKNSFTDKSICNFLSTKRLAASPSRKIEKCDKIKVENKNWTAINMTDFEKLESNAKVKYSSTLICL